MDPKDNYTLLFLRAANQDENKDFISSRSIWWYNQRNKSEGGLRLTEQGYTFVIEQAQIKEYVVPFPNDLKLTPQILIWLDKFIAGPYYINKKSIIVFSEKVAFELYLFSGDVHKMGAAKALSKHMAQD